MLKAWCKPGDPESIPHGGGATGDVLLHRTQSTVPPDQVGDHPSRCMRSKPPPLASVGISTATLALRLLKMCLTFQPWADCPVIGISPNQPIITHTVTCPQMDGLLDKAVHPCPLFQENSVCFAPLTEEFQRGETPLWVSPFTHGTPCLQFSQPKVLFKWLWRLFYIL